MFKYLLLIYLISRWLDWNPWNYLSHKDKESLYSLLREEKKYIIIGLISLFFTILGVLLDILGTIYVFLLPFFKQTYQEFKNFLFRLSVISYNQLFLLYLIPLILTGAALWYRQDESWEIALKRISPELEEYIGLSLFSIVIVLGFFLLFYDNTKNNITNRALSMIYGSPKPDRKEHWFLRFCYWLHPETYAIAKILNLVFLYVLFVHGTFYFFLGFYTFKGVYF
jgi:hypothetical protein